MVATTIWREPTSLLDVWERGASQRWTARGLLLLSETQPDADLEVLARLSIGHRDAHLLSLREALFGSHFQCWARCRHCNELVELDFHADDVRAAHAQPGQVHHLAAGDYSISFRLPDSTDLLAIEAERDPVKGTHSLLARCVVEVCSRNEVRTVVDLSEDLMSAIDLRMSELEPQAEVVLNLDCSACKRSWQASFDILFHLWSELDAWAKSFLREVHVLARHYGWSESSILAMTPLRRRFYLDQIAA